MNPFLELGPFDSYGHLNVILETIHCGPTEGDVFGFGSIPGTCTDSGAPLHAIVLLDSPAFAGAAIASRLVGVVGSECLVAVAIASRRRIEAVEEIHPAQLDEIEELLTAKGWRVHKARRGSDCAREILHTGLRCGYAKA